MEAAATDGLRSRRRTGSVALTLLALLFGYVASVHAAVTDVVFGGDTVNGAISDGSDTDRIPFRPAKGSLISFALKAGKGSALLPEVVILGVDRLPLPGAGAYLKVAGKGNAVSLKNLPIENIGVHYLEIRGRDGTTGTWTLTTKAKLPKGATGSATLPTDGGNAEIVFFAPGNATATLAVKAAKGSAGVPEFVALLNPASAPMLVDDVRPAKTGFSIKAFFLPQAGDYLMRLRAPGGAGATLVVKWKIPKPSKRIIDESEIVISPILSAITPAGGVTSDSLQVRIDGLFLIPGPTIRFSKPPTIVTVATNLITVDASGASFPLSLGSFTKGIYDVELINTDGGKGSLPQSFTVANSPALPVSISPDFGHDNEVIRCTVTGSQFTSFSTVRMEREGEVLNGTNVLVGGSQVSADFDLRGASHGFWDVVVTNVDAADAVLPGAFRVLNPPPVLLDIDPASNLEGDVVECTLTGEEFDAGATALLRRVGAPEISAAPVVVVGPTEITATFDTAGNDLGSWDVVVRNPDGREAVLPAAFRSAGEVADAARVLAFDVPATAPPAVAWNPTAGEFLLAWVEGNEDVKSWIVKAQRVDSEGKPMDEPVEVSTSVESVAKRDVTCAWSEDLGEYLVTWAETRNVTPVLPKGQTSHPWGTSPIDLFQILAQRLSGDALESVGKNVVMTDSTQFPAASGWVLEHFSNFRPSCVWDSGRSLWQVVFMQAWDTSKAFSADDFDVILRSLDPATDAVGDIAGTSGGVTGIASSQYHEGSPSIAFDPVGKEVVISYSVRTGSDSANMDLYVGVGGGGSVVVQGSSSDIADSRVVVDPDSNRILLTWTRVPASGPRSVEAVLVQRTSPTTKIGNVVRPGDVSEDEWGLAASVNGDLGEAVFAWSRLSSGGTYTVHYHRADTTADSGLVLLGNEGETTAEGGEAAGAAVVAPAADGEHALFWMQIPELREVNLPEQGFFPGSAVPGGEIQGGEVWLLRLR